MSTPEDIAVIGVGCRFPGATCLKEFWDVLLKGENHVTEIPPDRWDADTFHDMDTEAVGKSYSKRGGFIKDFAHFDNKLFGINESEASQMDPQQRQVLECTYMALENAGITRQEIAGQNVGVFIGAMNSDFTVRMTSNSHEIDNYSVAGLAGSIIANRVSYVYNLSGPSMVIDTACSSSLVAIHQAGLALRSGDCKMAICGGVNLMLHPTVFVPLSKARMLSPTGQCHAFSAEADGYTRGEGCGIVILKPLRDALKNGDNIWGTIMTGVNQDGRATQPITAPSGKQQKDLLDKVYTSHGIDPYTVEYIEAHGTGTRLGDPVEVGAFAEFFSGHGEQRQRYMGSVKTNIGHLEPAAGVAGLIKVLLMMKHNTIVPSLHFDKPNELIDFDKYMFTVPTKSLSWKSMNKVACINSFGFGGTNSHAVVRRHSKRYLQKRSSDNFFQIVCFSGSNGISLTKSLELFLSHDLSPYSLQALAYTSTVHREHSTCRKTFVASCIDDLTKQIQEAVSTGIHTLRKHQNIHSIFVFCGMGTAWKGMCNKLMDRYKIVRSTLATIETHLKTYVSWSLIKRLSSDHDVNDPKFGPIAIFACQIAVARLWESLGVKPRVVVGQSVGEVAAAHVAGVLSLGEAVRVIYHRTRILAQATGGKMLLIRNIDTKHVQKLCDGNSNIEIALYYSPVSCTVSGEPSAINELKSQFEDLKDTNKMLSVTELPITSAFHSFYMDPCQIQLDKVLVNLKSCLPFTSMISTVNTSMTDKELTLPEYWGMNVREPVQFSDAIKKSVLSDALNVFVEIGPKPVLGLHLQDIFKAVDVNVVSLPSLSEKAQEVSLLKSISFMYEHNVDIRWQALFTSHEPPTPVPCYTFSHKHLMILPVITEDEVFGTQSTSGDHLFVKQSSSNYLLSITPAAFASVYEHKVKGIIVVPGATYAEAGFGIGKALKFGESNQLVVSVTFSSPVTTRKVCPITLDVDVKNTVAEATFTIRQGEVIHACGTINKNDRSDCEQRLDIQMIQERCQDRVPKESVYQSLQYSGFTYGSSFATIEYSLRGKSEHLTKLKVGPRLKEEMTRTTIHPAILDGMLQSAAAATDVQEREFLPVELKNVAVYHPMECEMFVLTQMTEWTDTYTSFTLTLLSANGIVIAEVERFTTKFIGSESFDVQNVTFKTGLHSLGWLDITEGSDEGVIVFTDANLHHLKKVWTVHALDYMSVDDKKNQLDSVIHDVDLICFLFPLNSTSYESGVALQDELVKRVMSLRLILLYLANKMASIPLVIISELRSLGSSTGRECAGYCLSEAIKGFIRCVLREYKFLSIQLVDVEIDDDSHFVNHLPKVIQAAKSKEVRIYPEIKFHNGEISIHTILPYPRTTPQYRTSLMDDTTEAVLCSSSKRSISDPFFYPRKSKPFRTKDAIELTLNAVAVHDPNLLTVTVGMKSGYSGSDSHPVLCLEATGNTNKKQGREKQHEWITIFPTEVCRKVKIPKSCAIPRKAIPSYTLGLLTKMYVMWSVCVNVGRNHVCILHSRKTMDCARAMSDMLMSVGARSVSFTTPDELEKDALDQCTVMVSTIQMTKNLTPKILMHSENIRTVICFEKLTNKESLECLVWSKPSLRIHVIREEVFSQKCILQEVPKLLKWIRSHQQTVTDIANHLHSSQRECPSLSKIPIDILEIMQNTEIVFDPHGEIDCKYMRTQSEELFQKQGTYLVVGGLTGLGWECVLYLASRGAGCIVTLNRSKPNNDRQKDMNLLSQKYNCQIISMQTDVTEIKEVEITISQMSQFFSTRPLKGVFFGAAVLVDATLFEMSEEKLRRSLSPKVTGVWNLHILTSDLPLDFFVLHSSGAAMLGNAGQSNYGAGNGFLDGLAHCRRKSGISGQSINWGPLDLGLLDNKSSVLKRLQGQGYLVIQKKDIKTCLTHMLMLNEPQALICKIDRQKMAAQLTREKEKTLLTRLKTFLEPAIKNIDNKDLTSGVIRQAFNCDRLKFCSSEEGLSRLKEYLKYLICDKALLDESSFQMDTNTKDQGVDSMYAMEITGQIMSETGVKLSAHEIQLQPPYAIAKSLLKIIRNEGTADSCDRNTRESIVSKFTIMSSIANSICGFSYHSDFNMGFVIVSTIHVPDVVNTGAVVDLAKECISRHSITRTTWKFHKDSVITDELTVDKALDFRIISGSDASEVKLHTEDPIRLHIQGPLRFILMVKKLQLRMVFHKLAFDLKAITTLVQELESLSVAKENGQPWEDIPSDPDRDIADEIQKVLALNFQATSQFWKMKTIHMPYNSFSLSPVQNKEQENIFITRKIGKAVYSQILQFCRRQYLTAFEFLISVFQFLLAVVSNKSSSVVTISVDLRAHVPVLSKSLGRCTNFIPLICQLPENSTSVEDFLQKNKKDIEQFTKHGLLPSEEIKKRISEDGIRNFETNYFIYEDDIMTSELNQLQVDMPVIFSQYTETFFYIWQRKMTQTFEIKFHLKKDLFTSSRAEVIVDAFVGLVTDVISHSECTLGQLMRQSYMLMKEKKARQHQVSSACAII